MRRIVFGIAALLIVGPASAQDWAQWRGPARDGHLVGFKNPASWPAKLSKKWTVKIGEGHSSPIIVGNRAYVITRQGEQESTMCIDMANGMTVWQDMVAAPFDSVIMPARRLGKAPRSTPLFHEGKLYTIGVNGMMTCFNAKDGKIAWRKEFNKAFPIAMPICGASLSPLVDGKKIYVHAGHEANGAFFALDKDTGKELWAWKGEGPGYTSPMITTLAGVRQIVTASHNMWIGLSPEDGKLLWSINTRQNMFNHNSITAVFSGETVVCAGNQRPTFAIKVRKSGGKLEAEKVWETRDVTMSTSSPILAGNRLYAVNEKRRGQVVCMDFTTGKTLWECPGNKGEHVSMYDTGASLLVFTINGDLFVYKKGADTLTETIKYELGDSATWASPAISGNRLLVKGVETLTLWDIPTK